MATPQQFYVYETEDWAVSHRIDSALPGYLVISSKKQTNNLSELSSVALSDLGPLLASAQHILQSTLKAERVYIGRYGHMPGLPIHFHVIPIYRWVETLFWQDPRYRALETFAEAPGQTATDGAELTLFVWREFCERAIPPPIEGPAVLEAIELLRKSFQPVRV